MKRKQLLSKRQSTSFLQSARNDDGSTPKRSAILYESKKSKNAKRGSGEDGYFEDPSLAFSGNCCFFKLPDVKSATVRSRSIWLKEDHAVAKWTSNKSKSLKLGFCTLAKYFVGSTNENRITIATDFFDMLDSSYFGQDLPSKVAAPKECHLATGKRGYLLHQVTQTLANIYNIH